MKMLICEVCGCTDFYKASGYFFCATCQTQSQDIGEEVELELPIQNTTRLRRMRISRTRSNTTEKELGWTSWELYNFVLIGLTNELVELGVTADIKVTVLELWAKYLGKLEVAFTSTKKKLVPKLARNYKKRDAEIIYGKIVSPKRARKRRRTSNTAIDSATSTCLSEETSSRELNRNKKLMITADYDRFVQSQVSSEGDTLSTFNQSVRSVQSTAKLSSKSSRLRFNFAAKEEAKKVKNMAQKIPRHKRSKYIQNHVTSRYHTGPEIITPSKLWAILYLALRIHNQDIHLGDMLRYGREGHLSYYKLSHLIPPEVILTESNINFLSKVIDITHKGMRQVIGRMAKYLGVFTIICPDLSSLVNRYCSELDLPRGISLYAERLIALSLPKMKFHKFCIPNYEGRAMAFIIVVLKILLGLDGITEYEISSVADRINGVIVDEGICDTRLFSFREWQRYIEGRKAILMSVHCPTKLKYRSNIPDVNSSYIKFLESIDSKVDREDPEIITPKHLISRELVDAMKQCITNVSYTDLPLNEENKFPPSLTPHHSYFQQLLEHPLHNVPSILQNGFSSTKVGYMTKPEFIYKLISHYDIQLDFVYSNLHFIEKTVSLSEQTTMSAKDLDDDITVQDFVDKSAENIEKNEDFLNYLHFRKRPCQLKIDVKKRQYFDYMQNARITGMKNDPSSACSDEFIFDEILPDGKLSIPDKDNNEDKSNDTYAGDNVPVKTKLLFQFCKKYAINLSDTEKDAMFQDSYCTKQKKRKLFRNAKGKFVKHSAVSISQDKSSDKDEYKRDNELISSENLEVKNLLPEISDILNLSINASVFNDLEINEYNEHNVTDQSGDYRKILESAIEESLFNTLDKKSNDNIIRLFIPFKDYWMYHYNFSYVKLKNFELHEKMLPRSFRWLLNECANIIEMSTEDLYREVCLVEGYCARVLKQLETSTEDCNNQASINKILRQW